MFAAQNKLDNLCVILDKNQMQAMGDTPPEERVGSLADRFRAFGFTVRECGGHDHAALREALRPGEDGRPLCVVAHTVKGKGVSFMEHNLLWHYRDPQGAWYEQAAKELGDL